MEPFATARDLGRLAEIGAVLARHGFGDFVQRIGVARILERAGRALHWGAGAAPRVHLSTAARVREALQDLGPTFVKLGQLLSTRVDLFPPEWIAEFEKLQDQAPPSPWEAVRAQLVDDLGTFPEELFGEFHPTPIAAGSVAQVHRARLADGTPVAVKLRRPGIRATVEADLSLLGRLAQLAEGRMPDLVRFHPREVVRQLSHTLTRELDFAAECRNAERVARSFAGDPRIVVPKVYWTWTSERMNVQDFIDGIPSRDPQAVERAGLDRRALAHVGAQAMLKMVLEDGFFHADPHPGNLLYLPGNRLAFIDFGMVGRLSERRRDELVQLLNGLVLRDPHGVAEVLIEWAADTAVDTRSLEEDVDAFIDRYHGRPLAELRMGAMLGDLTRMLREHKLALPPELALVLKTAVSLESMGRELDPDFHMVTEAEPFLRAATLARYGPARLAQRGWRAARSALELMGELPRELRELLRSAKHGRLQVHVDVTSLERFGQKLDGAANRLTVGIVTAALIIGSSIVMTVGGGPTLFGLPSFGLIGFVGAGFGGTWLLFSIWRSGRAR